MAPRGRSRRSTKNALWPLDLTVVEGFDFNDTNDSDKNTWVFDPSSWLLGLNCPKTSQGVTDQRQNANRSKSNSQIEWGTAAALPNTRRDTALSTQHLLQNTDFSSLYALWPYLVGWDVHMMCCGRCWRLGGTKFVWRASVPTRDTLEPELKLQKLEVAYTWVARQAAKDSKRLQTFLKTVPLPSAFICCALQIQEGHATKSHHPTLSLLQG